MRVEKWTGVNTRRSNMEIFLLDVLCCIEPRTVRDDLLSMKMESSNYQKYSDF